MSHEPASVNFNLDDLLDQIIQRTREIIPFESGGVAVYDAESGLLAPRTYHTTSPDAPRPRLIRLGEGIAGVAAELRQPLLIDDVSLDTRYIAYDSETRSQIAVPIILGGELLGVLSAESYQTHAYTAQHLKILSALADQAALALHTARLYETLAQRYERLNVYNTQLVLRNEISRMATSDQALATLIPQMAQRLAQLIGVEVCALTLWDAVRERAVLLTAYGIDPAEFVAERRHVPSINTFTKQIVRIGQPLIVNDITALDALPLPLLVQYDIHAVLAIPLVARGRAIGAALMAHREPDCPFTQADVDNAASVLDQIALAIDNGVLLQDTQARFSETSILLEIAAIASSSLELDDLLAQVLGLSQRMLGVTAGAVLMYDRASNELTPHRGATFGFSDEVLTNSHFPANDPHSRIAVVFSSGTGYFSNNLIETTHSSYRFLAVATGLPNLLFAPLRVQDEPMGVFLVGGKRTDFTKTDLDLTIAMGSHVAAALRNADLFSAMRERLRETEALQHIAVISSATLDLDDLLENAVGEASQLLDVEGAFLLMPDSTGTLLVPHQRSMYGLAHDMQVQPLRTDSGLQIATVYQTGQPYLSNEAEDDPLIQQRSVLAYPINVRNRTLGVLVLINRRSGDFEDVHSDLARAVAAQIAISMENAGLFTAERQRADLMSLINTISQELTATLDLRGLLRKVVKAIHERLGYEAACVYTLDDSQTRAIAQASAAETSQMAVADGFTFPVTRGIVGRAIRERKTQLATDVTSDPDFFWPSAEHRAASVLVVLLSNRERILGAIEIVSSSADAFHDAARTALETLATQVSTVIENAHLWDQAQRRLLEQGIVQQIAQDLTSILDYGDLVNAVVRHMNRALDTALCLLIVYNDETTQATVDAEYRASEVSGHPLPRFVGQPPGAAERLLIDRAILTRQPAVVYRDSLEISPDQHRHFAALGIDSEMALPMIAADRVTGCMLWIELRGPRSFSDSDIRLAQTLTSQAAIAVENARLYRQAQRQAREQAILRSAAINLNAVSDTDTLLKRFASELILALDADNVLVALRDEEGIFRIKAHVLTTGTPGNMLLGRTQGWLAATWEALDAGQILTVSSAQPPDSETQYEEAQHEIAQILDGLAYSLVLVPIVRRSETIGLLEIAYDDPLKLFDGQSLILLEALANQGSVAIDNVGLNEREQRRLNQLEKVQMSSRLLAGQLQVDVLMAQVVSEAAGIFEAPAAVLAMPDAQGHYYEGRAAFGLSDRYINERLLLVGQVNRDAPTYTRELRDRSSQPELIRDEGLRSSLTIPISKAGQHLGLLVLYSRGLPRIFHDEEIELAQLFAGQAAVALENARLFSELEERAIELAKANKLKSEFLARISHELRTPMNSINGYSDMLLHEIYGTLNEKQSDRMERILRNGRNLLALIDDLLDISKIDAGKMDLRLGAVNLRDELNATIYTMESQAVLNGLYLRSNVPDDLPLVRADATRLKQIFTNLLGNAIKFTKVGGITVEAQVRSEGGRSVLWTQVIDTGIGIQPEDYEMIFDEFRQVDGGVTREYGGTGLGLAITRKLVDMMNGRIWVESEMGRGSVFTFVLPIVTETDQALAS